MHVHLDGTTPIYIQIAEWLQHEIIADRLQTDAKVYSQYQLAELFNINPATAGKGLTILLEEQLLYKNGVRYVCRYGCKGTNFIETSKRNIDENGTRDRIRGKTFTCI